MKYSTVSNPVFINESKSAINCNVLFDGFGKEVVFTASLSDAESHGVEIFQRCMSGEFGGVAEYITPEIDVVTVAEQQKESLLEEASQKTALWRTQLLLGVITDDDKTKLTDWMIYVQKLLAIDTSTAPDIQWPKLI